MASYSKDTVPSWMEQHSPIPEFLQKDANFALASPVPACSTTAVTQGGRVNSKLGSASGGPGEEPCDQPPGQRADLRVLPPAPSSGLFGPRLPCFSRRAVGRLPGSGWDHRAAPGARPAAPRPPPAPGAGVAGAPSLRLQKALPSLSSRLHIRAQAHS